MNCKYFKVKTYDEIVLNSRFDERLQEVRNNEMSENEIMKKDYTIDFWEELVNMYNYKELINIAVIGKVTKGKSTVAIAIAREILTKMLNKKMSINNILDDQISYQRVIKNPELENDCHVIDEDNRLSRTGMNATIEITQLQSFSEIQAQRYLHRIACSPSNVEDVETAIILEIIAAYKEQLFTRCKLYYKINTPIGIITQVLGYVDIDVSEVINEEFYKKYRDIKFKKMELMNKYAINDRREMDFANIVLNIYDELKDIAKFERIPESFIDSALSVQQLKMGFNLSIIAEEKLKKRAYALLQLETKIASENFKSNDTEKLQKSIEFRDELLNHYKQIQKVYNEFLSIRG